MSRWNRFQEIADLPIRAFRKVGRKMTLEGGDGGPSETTSTNTTSNLPEYARPYFEDLMGRTQKASLTPFQAYTGQRVAGFDPAQQQAFGATQDMFNAGTPQGLQAGQGMTANAAGQFAGYNYNPTTGSMQSTASQQLGPQLDASNAATVSSFMNPYMQQVVDVQKTAAAREYQIADQMRNKQAAAAGAFGGARQAVYGAEAQKNLMGDLQGIQAKGSSEAFGRAQDAINQQRQASIQAGTANMQSDLQSQQQNQQTYADMIKQAEQSRQFGAQSGLEAAKGLGQMGQQMGAMGETEQALEMQRTGALEKVGQQQQQLSQQQMEQQYADFVNARDYERQQLNFYNSIMRGIPVAAQQEVITSRPSASLASQLGGAGIAGLGSYNEYNRK